MSAKKQKLFKFNEEATTPGIHCQNTHLLSEINRLGKMPQYQQFAHHFPNGQLGEKFLQYLHSLTPAESTELAKGLYSLDCPSQLTPAIYADRASVWGRMFDLSTRGSGKGEIPIIWLIAEAYMNGGSDSYDINHRGRKYEVKDWSLQGHSAILAGVKSKVTNFEFWNEIVDTIRRLEKLTHPTPTGPKFNLQLLSPEIATSAQKVLNRREKILSGECNLTDIKNLSRLYRQVASINHPSTGYTNLILRGPNVKPLELSITELPPAIQRQIQIEVDQLNDETYTLTELRRLRYCRRPELLQLEMQQAVNEIIGDITYIVFRAQRINITQDFIPHAITISSLKFVEREV